jgi:hypothetical protein
MRAELPALTALFTFAGCAGHGAAPVPAPKPIHPFVLEAPRGVDRWEPSGDAVLANDLWVVNDRDGWIAAYPLPLHPGVNTPDHSYALKTGLPRTKWEDAAPAPDGGLLLWEAVSRTLWHCGDPAAGCPDLAQVDSEAFRKALDAALPVPVEYVTVEGFARQGDRTWVATRGLVPRGQDPKTAFECWPRLFGAQGPLAAFDGKPWMLDGHPYSISGLALDGDTLWMTWSYEAAADDSRDGVAGLLARAKLGPDGQPGPPELCRRFVGKPEGVALWNHELVVVFDDDLARKGVNDPRRFPLDPRQDFAEVLDKVDACPVQALTGP